MLIAQSLYFSNHSIGQWSLFEKSRFAFRLAVVTKL
jgi:hypothetical protein